jgi:signal transduction histidine kinase
MLVLDLFASPLTATGPLLVALITGLAALLLGGVLLMWAVSRWLVAPLRELNVKVDAVAGGDTNQLCVTSPIREVDHIAQAVAGMGTSLAHTAERDQRLETERTLLVSSIAHDLRTPLFSLRGYLDAIEMGIGDPRERLAKARAKAHQIDRLVNDLFDYARRDLNRPPCLETTDLTEAVADVTGAFRPTANERSVKICVTGQTRHSVRIDRDGFQRALSNVMDNALRYTPSGGTVLVDCGSDAAAAFVRVTDGGPGIPSHLLASVFEPSVRGDGAGSAHSDGLGLGLTIAARLLRNQGGTIDATNATPHGAILTLRIPNNGR